MSEPSDPKSSSLDEPTVKLPTPDEVRALLQKAPLSPEQQGHVKQAVERYTESLPIVEKALSDARNASTFAESLATPSGFPRKNAPPSREQAAALLRAQQSPPTEPQPAQNPFLQGMPAWTEQPTWVLDTASLETLVQRVRSVASAPKDEPVSTAQPVEMPKAWDHFESATRLRKSEAPTSPEPVAAPTEPPQDTVSAAPEQKKPAPRPAVEQAFDQLFGALDGIASLLETAKALKSGLG